MVKLMLNHEDQDLAYRFNISRPVVHSVFHTWLQFLFFELKETVQFIPKTTVDQHMPKDFKAKYPTTRVILDATEVSYFSFIKLVSTFNGTVILFIY